MAKSTSSRGATFTQHELSDPTPPPRVRRAMLGGDPKSVGTDYSEPSLSESRSSAREKLNPQGPVRTTESLSDRTDQEDSTANSTDGDGPVTETESDEVPYSEWDYRDLQAECKERGLPANGSTEELIARLEEWDASQFPEEDADDDFS